jgi:putative salt-induced outer membrane protein YdiY
MYKRLSILLLSIFTFASASAQDWAIKSNLAYDASASMNLGVEVALADRWTLDISGNYNPFTINKETNMKWKHWLVQPEARYWFCRKFGGHFFAGHLWGGQYNVGNVGFIPDFLGTPFSQLKDHRYEGWFAGAGIGYGYAWMLGKHWNLEAEIGVGYAYTNFDKYFCPKCGEKIGNGDHHYIGPTKAAINLVYLF